MDQKDYKMRLMRITTVLVVICFARWGSGELPACEKDEPLCGTVNNSRCDPATQRCVCNDGFHASTNSTNYTICIEDLAPGETCATDVECVSNATCRNVTTTDAAAALQCACDEGFHEVRPEGGAACQNDLRPGENCTKENSADECSENAVCRKTQSGEQISQLQCQCDSDYHTSLDSSGKAFCEMDLRPGENCTKENSADECSENAVCRKTQSGEQISQLQCQCDSDYHTSLDSSGKAFCEMDTCEDSLKKCTDAGLDSCSKTNTYFICVIASQCNHSSPADVDKCWVALTAAKDYVTENCTYPAEGACEEQIAACFNKLFKGDTTCSTIDALGACLTNSSCADDNAFSLARAVLAKADNQISCTCIRGVDQCVTTFVNASQNRTDQEKCTSVKTLFQCLFGTPCQANVSIDGQKLSQAWSQAVDSAIGSHCSLTTEDAGLEPCPQQLTLCALLYAGGLDNATSKDQQCRTVAEFDQCLERNTTDCLEDQRLIVFRDQQKAAVSSFHCECLVAIDSCEASYFQKQNATQDVTVKCLSVATYTRCLLEPGRCNLSDPVDSTRLARAQSTANKERDDNNCKFTQAPNGSCENDMEFCSNDYNTVVTGQPLDAQRKCDSSRNLVLCLRAARCSETVASEQSLYNATSQEALFKLQSLDGCLGLTCFASYQMVLMCKDAYTQTPKNTSQEICSAMNEMVKCLKQKLCNSYLDLSIRAQYQDLMSARDPSCQLSPLSTDGGQTNIASLLAVIVTALVAFVIATV